MHFNVLEESSVFAVIGLRFAEALYGGTFVTLLCLVFISHRLS